MITKEKLLELLQPCIFKYEYQFREEDGELIADGFPVEVVSIDNLITILTNEKLLDKRPVDALVNAKIADELKQLMIDADSLLTLFVFSEHIFNEKKAERKKEAGRIAIGLRKIYESNFSL